MKTSSTPQKPKRVAASGGSIRGEAHGCFGCGPGNRQGLRLHFQENSEDGVECIFQIPRRFEGPPGHLHGGIIAAVLDEAMGKINRQEKVVALTRRMSIDFLRPVPLRVKLHAVGWPVKVEGRKHFRAAEIRTLGGDVLARSEGMFVAIDPEKMFQKHRDRFLTAGITVATGTAKLTG